MNNATKFSNLLISILKTNLKITENENSEPVFVETNVTKSDLVRFKSALRDLYNSDLVRLAIDNLYNIVCDKNNIVSTGVGLVKDFSLFINMGYFLGTKLVLWDTLIYVYLQVDVGEIDKMELGLLACSYIALEKIIFNEEMYILPHPLRWSDKAKYNYRKIMSIYDKLSTTGILTIKSIIDEGFSIHPYTIENNYIQNVKQIKRSEYYNSDKIKIHDGIENLFKDQRFTFLRNISTEKLYEILKKRNRKELVIKIQKLFSASMNGFSPYELDYARQEINNSIHEEINKINNSMLNISQPTTENILNLITTITGIATTTPAILIPTIITGSTSIYNNILSILNEKKSEFCTLYQVFSEIENSEEDEYYKKLRSRVKLGL